MNLEQGDSLGIRVVPPVPAEYNARSGVPVGLKGKKVQTLHGPAAVTGDDHCNDQPLPLRVGRRSH
jgi:hypothetical protein